MLNSREPSKFQIGFTIFLVAFICISSVCSILMYTVIRDKNKHLQYQLSEKSFIVRKEEAIKQIKLCESLRESTNGYHSGNWYITVSDEGAVIRCVQQGYKVPR